jgi:hypothetical protein
MFLRFRYQVMNDRTSSPKNIFNRAEIKRVTLSMIAYSGQVVLEDFFTDYSITIIFAMLPSLVN